MCNLAPAAAHCRHTQFDWTLFTLSSIVDTGEKTTQRKSTHMDTNNKSEGPYLQTWLDRLGKSTLTEDCRLLPLHEMFHRQAKTTPYATAVVDDTRSLTYEELNLRVLLPAEHLRT